MELKSINAANSEMYELFSVSYGNNKYHTVKSLYYKEIKHQSHIKKKWWIVFSHGIWLLFENKITLKNKEES